MDATNWERSRRGRGEAVKIIQTHRGKAERKKSGGAGVGGGGNGMF